MTTLNHLILNLQKLQTEGHGDKVVKYTHGASGVCGSLGSAQVTTDNDEELGPFDIEPGTEYISIYAGE